MDASLRGDHSPQYRIVSDSDVGGMPTPPTSPAGMWECIRPYESRNAPTGPFRVSMPIHWSPARSTKSLTSATGQRNNQKYCTDSHFKASFATEKSTSPDGRPLAGLTAGWGGDADARYSSTDPFHPNTWTSDSGTFPATPQAYSIAALRASKVDRAGAMLDPNTDQLPFGVGQT